MEISKVALRRRSDNAWINVRALHGPSDLIAQSHRAGAADRMPSIYPRQKCGLCDVPSLHPPFIYFSRTSRCRFLTVRAGTDTQHQLKEISQSDHIRSGKCPQLTGIHLSDLFKCYHFYGIHNTFHRITCNIIIIIIIVA